MEGPQSREKVAPEHLLAQEMTCQVRALNYLKDCRGGSFVPNPA
jgi:hypothetical protein